MVDGESLLRALVKADGGHADFMGCFVAGYPEANDVAMRSLLGTTSPETDDGRVLLYICPECGDIACGAYAVRVVRKIETYTWSDFAYVNG